MTFVQIEFVALFAATFAMYWLLPSRRGQNLLLVGVSAVFYGWLHPWFLLLLYGSATLDYWVARGIAAAPWHRRKLLALSVAGNLGVLGFFKYFDFFVTNVADALVLVGLQPNLSSLGLILPVGISFYTFQTLSYSIDVYRGVLRPRTDFIDYLAFVSFFSQLVAGPIERAARLLPQRAACTRALCPPGSPQQGGRGWDRRPQPGAAAPRASRPPRPLPAALGALRGS